MAQALEQKEAFAELTEIEQRLVRNAQRLRPQRQNPAEAVSGICRAFFAIRVQVGGSEGK